MNHPGMLVCALANAPLVIAGSVFDRACVRCRRQLAIAPTGQDMLRRRPDLETLCGECFAIAIVALEIAAVFELPAGPDESIEDRRN